MLKRMNKKGFGIIMLVSMGVAILVIGIVASILGLAFISKLLKEISPGYLLTGIIILLAIVFRPIVMEIGITILSIIKSFAGFLK